MATRGGGKRPQRGALSLGSAGQREVANAETRTATNQVNSSWELLHDDVLELIADRVLAGDLLDYIWFRASCKTWRAATPCSLGRGVVDPRFHPRQWTMFPEGSGLHPGHPALGGYIRFLNIYTGIFIRVHLPCFEDHSVLDCPDGLLLLQRNKDASICLLHPFTGDAAEFPPLASLCLYMSKFGIFLNGPYDLRLRMVHAAVSVNAGATVTIMLALSHLERMAYVSTGDRQWTHTSWMIFFFEMGKPPPLHQNDAYGFLLLYLSLKCKHLITAHGSHKLDDEWHEDSSAFSWKPLCREGFETRALAHHARRSTR
ncbi:unnamed protein product [Alopecurus aequalis]